MVTKREGEGEGLGKEVTSPVEVSRGTGTTVVDVGYFRDELGELFPEGCAEWPNR